MAGGRLGLGLGLSRCLGRLLWLGFMPAAAALAAPPPAPPSPAASAARPATAASAASAITQEPVSMPRVELSGVADAGEGARRNESIAKTIYGREELDRQGDLDVTDVLKRLPGVSMDEGAPRLRGLGGGYTQILINGEPAPPGFALDSLAPADVERIEVIKGATAEYSGVAGTINVVLREPPRSLQREWRGGLSLRGDQPSASTSLQWGDRTGALSYVLPLSLASTGQGSESLSERSSRSPAGQLQAQAIASADQGRSGRLQFAPRLLWKISDSDSLNASLLQQRVDGRNRGARRLQRLAGAPLTTVQDRSHSRSDSALSRLQLQWQRRASSGGKLELKGSWQHSERSSLGDYEGWRADGRRTLQRQTLSDFDETRRMLAARWSQPLGEAHSLSLGLELETRQRGELRRVWEAGVERLDSATGRPFAADISRQALFVQDEWALNERWALLPGLRIEQISTRSGGAASREIDQRSRVVAPSLHLNHRFDPKGRDQLRASLSRSFKLPELSLMAGRYLLNGNYERDVSNTPIAADRAGNPALQPELATGLDLAYEHYPAGGGVLSLGLFYRRIDALIRQSIRLEQNPAPDITALPRWVSRPANIGRASSLGLELEIKGAAEQWLPTLFGRSSGVQLRGAWNAYRSRVDQVDGPDNRLEAQPPWSANMGFDARLPGSRWTLGASLVLQPGYSTRQTDRQLSRRSGLRALDAYASWRMDRNSQLRLGLQNLLRPTLGRRNLVEDLDGFEAGSRTWRESFAALNASWVQRF